MASFKSFIKKHKIDIIVISSLLLISIAFLLITQLTREEGAYVEIKIDGKVITEIPLEASGVYTLNHGTNELTIKDGVAYMTYSSCPDHTCENTGKVKYVGETIVCLPNKVHITIIGPKDDTSVDFTS